MTPLDASAFSASQDRFEALVGFLQGDGAAGLSHDQLEAWLNTDGRELLRQLFQDHLNLRAAREVRIASVVDAVGVARGAVEGGHVRSLVTLFGEVTVARMAYRAKGSENLHPADGALNLPEGLHSHGLGELAAVEAAKGSFGEAKAAIAAATGVVVGKRQLEALARSAAGDAEDFYADRPRPEPAADDIIVISADGKGIVMRPEALRPATAARAASSANKLDSRLSGGEKANRKRIAEVGVVYQLTPAPRSPADIFPPAGHVAAPAPLSKAKWLTASVVDDAAVVVAQVFDEAERRDPDHRRYWVALVDGNNHQLSRIRAEAKTRGVSVTVVDFIHVLEYLWSAAWSFFWEGDRTPSAAALPAAQARIGAVNE